MGNKSSNGDMDPHANQGASSDDFDALFVLKTIITIGIGVAAGLFGAVLCVSVLQHCSKPPLEGMVTFVTEICRTSNINTVLFYF